MPLPCDSCGLPKLAWAINSSFCPLHLCILDEPMTNTMKLEVVAAMGELACVTAFVICNEFTCQASIIVSIPLCSPNPFSNLHFLWDPGSASFLFHFFYFFYSLFGSFLHLQHDPSFVPSFLHLGSILLLCPRQSLCLVIPDPPPFSATLSLQLQAHFLCSSIWHHTCRKGARDNQAWSF